MLRSKQINSCISWRIFVCEVAHGNHLELLNVKENRKSYNEQDNESSQNYFITKPTCVM